MKTKHQKPLIAMALAAIAFTMTGANAAVTFFGNVEGAEVTDWRTAATIKSADVDGDNFYGTYGAVHWNLASTNEQAAGSTSPGWAYHGAAVGFVGQPTNIDHITNYPSDAGAGIVFGAPATFTFELTGIPTTYVGMTVRVGVMHDLLSPSEWATDDFKGLQISQTVGGSGDSGVISLRSGGAGNGSPDMYFFDLTNVTAGDRFQIRGLRDVGGTSGSSGYIGPVSFDLIPNQAPHCLVALA